MLEQDAVFSKVSIIKNCLNTIREITGLDPRRLDDFIVQDVFVLNLQRAIQAAIDIAHLLISANGWRMPAAYRESFIVLNQNGVIDLACREKMIKMTGFRNIAVHDYRQLSPVILKAILTGNLKDVESYYSAVLDYLKARPLTEGGE